MACRNAGKEKWAGRSIGSLVLMRNIVIIDKDRCDGCGQCVEACAEGAIELIDGKAKLVSEIYCDGLGACIGHCPRDAITVERRQAAGFDQEAVKAHLAGKKTPREKPGFVCPGMAARSLGGGTKRDETKAAPAVSRLGHWPVQLKLVPPQAPFFAGADLLLVADCVPFAMGDFHERFLKDRSVAVGCPKLDDSQFYVEKLAEILKSNKLGSLAVIHMEVPCCSGLTRIAEGAVALSGAEMPFEDITVDLRGNVIKTQKIRPLPRTAQGG